MYPRRRASSRFFLLVGPNMSFAPWSISKAQVAHTCGMRFDYTYVNRKPKRATANTAGRIGSAVHRVLELMVKGYSFEDAFRAAVMHRQVGAELELGLTHKEMLELKSYRSSVHRFMEKFEAYKAQFEIEGVFVELKVAVDANLDLVENWFDNDTVYFRGIFDLAVLLRRNGQQYLVIIDHKSGDPKDITEYMDQLNAYLVMAVCLYPDLAGAQAAIHWLRAEEELEQPVVEWTPLRSRSYIDAQVVPWLHQYLSDAQVAAEASQAPTAGWYCEFCDFRHLCPLIK